MPGSTFDPQDLDKARELLSAGGHTEPVEVTVEIVARAVNAERRAHVADAMTVGELLAAHDVLYASRAFRQASGLLERLATALLARGVVPAPDDYGGNWWLWWPPRGRGYCQSCGNERPLRRYSARFGKKYRYLCQGCRAQENADEEAHLNEVTGVIPDPGESADSLLTRRLSALFAQEDDGRTSLASRPEERAEDQ
jgi:hypothetical protein